MNAVLEEPARDAGDCCFLPAINPDGFDTINAVFHDAIRRYGDRPAFSALGLTLSYKNLERQSRDFAAYLQSRGLKAGDRIAVQLPNVTQYPVVVFGALRAGLIVVNTNPLYTAREMLHQFNDSNAKAIVILANCCDRLAEILPETGLSTVIVTEIADMHRPFKRVLINSVVKRVKKLVPPYHLPTAIPFTRVMKQGKGLPLTEHQPQNQDLAVLQYTGGTTGVAKGAMLTHANLVANMLQLRAHFGDFLRAQQEIFIGPLPLYHIYAFTLHCMLLTNTGNHSVLIPNPRDLRGFVKELKKWRFTGFAGLNTLFVALANDAEFKQLDFTPLRFTASGGMALTQAGAALWEQVTGNQVIEGYGLTETSPGATFNKPDDIVIGSIGYPLPYTEAKVIDVDGNSLPSGQAGELCLRGPQVMKGYWQREDETAKVLDADGWFRTGDMAEQSPDGRLKIVDRKKDMIIVSGFNVYPNEIEDVICTMPGIRECAAIGVPDEKCGEAVVVYVVAHDEALDEAAVRTYCRERLTAYKVPRFVHFCDDLPKSNVGKVLRRALRTDHQNEAPA
ncbi:AMP-binding protein [Motiliproteus sediminis]|uniref:AMP-binding protein n=1 Tax=Motiliproteus sediminis TaxID=1468178 RepID=UPI001AF01E3B|nr:AMP-binding protein [Motiliproteus sediminis]